MTLTLGWCQEHDWSLLCWWHAVGQSWKRKGVRTGCSGGRYGQEEAAQPNFWLPRTWPGFLSPSYSLCQYMRGTPQTGIFFWRAGSLYYRLPPLGECSRSPSVSVYQWALLWEAVSGFSEFFLKTLSMHFPFHGGWFTSAPAHMALALCLAAFDEKWHGPMPHPPYSPYLALSNFFLFP